SIIYVPNTLKALHAIARYRRLQRATEVVAVTGTNGKTTTKEMIAKVLEKRFRVLKSSGNLNNHVGLPLCLSQLNGEDFAVLEMGASQVGDIRQLCEIALPGTGVLTNIGPAHLEGFGSIEQVLKTKMEILDFVDRVVLNRDDHLLREALNWKEFHGKDVLTYGLQEGADIRAENILSGPEGLSFKVHVGGKVFSLRLRVHGRFNVYNALAATGVCKLFGCLDTVAEALEGFEGVPMRLEVKHLRDVTFLSDMYNANPASMEEALKELVAMKTQRAIAVLGDMLELGAYEEKAHRDLGEMVARLPLEVFIAVGERMRAAAEVVRSTVPERDVIV
ncbi:MAG: UDP-N-acetylmuramoyl-tripeptide--D-alanyl-D-alanine ligase, partial [Nitrospirae bacterium]